MVRLLMNAFLGNGLLTMLFFVALEFVINSTSNFEIWVTIDAI